MPATATTPTADQMPALAQKGHLAQNAEKLAPGQTADDFDPTNFVAECKADGWRVLVGVTEDAVHIYSRSGKNYGGSLPTVEAELAANLPPGSWLDCEAVALTIEDGKVIHDWGTVQSVLGSSAGKAATQEHKVTLMAFDLLAHGGHDARSLPFAKRRALLEQVFAGGSWERTILMPQLEPSAAAVDALMAQGFEGAVIKDRRMPYCSGKRGAGWTKVKNTDAIDVVVMGFKPGENGFAGLVGSIIFGAYDGAGKLVEVGRCSGFDMALRQKLTATPDAYLGRVLEVKHMGQMPSGGYRHPQAGRWRPDKAAAECTLEALNG